MAQGREVVPGIASRRITARIMSKSSPRRRPKKHYPLQGTTLLEWQADTDLVRWAQEEPRFRLALNVLINERNSKFVDSVMPTESRQLGRVEGFEKAIGFFEQLQRSRIEQPPVDENITYESTDQ